MNVQSGTKGFVSEPLEQRFWAKVKKTASCWLWVGANNTRYGQIWVEGKKRKATHVSLALVGRNVGPGQVVCHHCDTPACVRPDHLFVGTMGDNTRDMIKKRRHGSITKPSGTPRGDLNGSRTKPERLARGERNGQSVLTELQVKEIRRLKGVIGQRPLGVMFGVNSKTIHNIHTGKQWRAALSPAGGKKAT